MWVLPPATAHGQRRGRLTATPAHETGGGARPPPHRRRRRPPPASPDADTRRDRGTPEKRQGSKVPGRAPHGSMLCSVGVRASRGRRRARPQRRRRADEGRRGSRGGRARSGRGAWVGRWAAHLACVPTCVSFFHRALRRTMPDPLAVLKLSRLRVHCRAWIFELLLRSPSTTLAVTSPVVLTPRRRRAPP